MRIVEVLHVGEGDMRISLVGARILAMGAVLTVAVGLFAAPITSQVAAAVRHRRFHGRESADLQSAVDRRRACQLERIGEGRGSEACGGKATGLGLLEFGD